MPLARRAGRLVASSPSEQRARVRVVAVGVAAKQRSMRPRMTVPKSRRQEARGTAARRRRAATVDDSSASNATRKRHVSRCRRQNAICAAGSSSSRNARTARAPAGERSERAPEGHHPLGGAERRGLAGDAPPAYASWSGLMSTATTSCRADSASAVQPAEAMQKTRPPGRNAPSSIAASSYMRPKRSLLGPARASKRPRAQAVSVDGSRHCHPRQARRDPGQHQEREVLDHHAARDRG